MRASCQSTARSRADTAGRPLLGTSAFLEKKHSRHRGYRVPRVERIGDGLIFRWLVRREDAVRVLSGLILERVPALGDNYSHVKLRKHICCLYRAKEEQ